jgi:nitrogenase molybdenum-iron protein alpha/beta subunit
VAASFREIDFTADDRLNVALASFVEEIGSGKEVAVIGDGNGWHFLARSLVEEFGGFAGAVEETVVRVDVKMDELRLAHGI